MVTLLPPEKAREAARLWLGAQTIYPTAKPLWVMWKDRLEAVEALIRTAAEGGRCFALLENGAVRGFLCAEMADFHGERVMVAPYCGLALGFVPGALSALYAAACAFGAENGATAHRITLDANDRGAQRAFAPFGFGLCSVGAFESFQAAPGPKPGCTVSPPSEEDVPELFALYEGARDRALAPPRFLRLPEQTPKSIGGLVRSGAVLAAREDGQISAMADFTVAERDDAASMCAAGTALFCRRLGLCCRPGPSGSEGASALASGLAGRAAQSGAAFAHVTWETADRAADAVWRKLFRPSVFTYMRALGRSH